ncbi:adenine deaminase [Taibaiella lutea]|uniref:Adenine deaminase n=1 Tax=Taibaiella lutea TaxID=2608001 RepID=A0A5M6CNL9_9BACT|nr:adenine deaminase [Taibaiella lutea]KAA5536643.1 adenine deaminase [Taibaiella lutea]
MQSSFFISGQYVDILNRTVFPANIQVENGKILSVEKVEKADDHYILPGFIDAHIHIESSMLVPTEFAAIAVKHGTVATVSDPHEIANVCGIAGVDYMIENAGHSPLKFNFGAPSCVPATTFETAGAVIDSNDIKALLQRKEIKYLTEMMNFPGVLFEDREVMLKIAAAKALGKPVDGHAPGLRGKDAFRYAAAGITTDHECVSIEEANDKLAAGMNILIREGSAAKNYTALAPLLKSHPGKIMFCSDDKHPDELCKGHINLLVKRAVAEGYDLFNVLYASCILPVLHYGLDVGYLLEGQAADFIVVKDLKEFEIEQVYIDGSLIVENNKSFIETTPVKPINHFSISPLKQEDFQLKSKDRNAETASCKIIDALDGQLITNASEAILKVADGNIITDIRQDVLKIGVVNRYNSAPVSMGFIRNFGLQRGAIASSVAHDSHNIVFVGVDDNAICEAVNAIIDCKGGISICDGTATDVMPLPVAGLMSDKDAFTAAAQYEKMDKAAKALGSKLTAPFMTLSFMALPVIPSLKITDKGLFDVDRFDFVTL